MVDTKENGKDGISDEPSKSEAAQKEALDPARAFIFIDDAGWLTARIHCGRGFYAICGFLKEVEDNLRKHFSDMKKREQEKQNLIKPGFRGFNMFKRNKG